MCTKYKIIFLLVAMMMLSPFMPRDVLAQQKEPPIWQLIAKQVELSGAYKFTAQIEQTLIPQPIPANIGQQENRYDSFITGEVILPDFARLDLKFEAATQLVPITIEQDGLDTYLI
ncbi:MAG TPA: hypothetical protein VLL52_16115 [Anaerolineae bacterium]|nr:hypothetical protein [Anaerolineae bacterium]